MELSFDGGTDSVNKGDLKRKRSSHSARLRIQRQKQETGSILVAPDIRSRGTVPASFASELHQLR